jgi:hypothetical protein
VNSDDVRVSESCDRFGLALESLAGSLSKELIRTQQFDRDFATQRRLLGQQHDAHPAAPETADDPQLAEGLRKVVRIDEASRGKSSHSAAKLVCKLRPTLAELLDDGLTILVIAVRTGQYFENKLADGESFITRWLWGWVHGALAGWGRGRRRINPGSRSSSISPQTLLQKLAEMA